MSELPIPAEAIQAATKAVLERELSHAASYADLAEAALRAGLEAMGMQVEYQKPWPGHPSAPYDSYRWASRWLPVEQGGEPMSAKKLRQAHDQQEAMQAAKRDAHVGSMAPGEAFRFGWAAGVRWAEARTVLRCGDTRDGTGCELFADHDGPHRAGDQFWNDDESDPEAQRMSEAGKDTRELENVDDFTHYFNATGRLSRENSDLRAALSAVEAERDANANHSQHWSDKAARAEAALAEALRDRREHE